MARAYLWPVSLPLPRMRRRSWIVPLFFLCLSLALRWGSFSLSVIDHDESTYIVGADELLRGETYLRDVIDTKPVGIFWLYAALISLTGGSIWLLRFAAAVFVALGGWLLCRVARQATGQLAAGFVAGCVYVFMCSVYTYYGISPNTEIFFNVCTIAAVATTVAARRKRWGLGGLFLGAGFVIKPFVAAEALAIGLYLVWLYHRTPGVMIRRGLRLVAGFSLIPALVICYFAQHHLLDQLYFYTFEVAAAYPIELPWYLRLKYMGDYALRYSPFLLPAIVLFYRRPRPADLGPWFYYLALQAVLVSTVVLLTGKRFGHYQIQLHPIVALYVGSCAGLVWTGTRRVHRYAVAGVLAVAVAIGIGHALYYSRKDDESRRIAAVLGPLLDPGETFFGMNGFQITYHLLDRPVPTPYIHSSLLFYDHHVRAFQINEAAEGNRIVADPTVRYVVRRVDDTEAESTLGRRVSEAFVPFRRVDDNVEIWRRKQ